MDDKRVSKMTLETAQMYCTAMGVGPYKPVHQHNPLTPWCKTNISWLIRFHHALAGEYYYRTGKAHSSFVDVGQHMIDIPDQQPINFLKHQRSPIPSVIYGCNDGFKLLAIDYGDLQDVHYGYRCYLRARWWMDKKSPVWTRRPPPFWLDETPPYEEQSWRGPGHHPHLLRSIDVIRTDVDRWTTIIREGTTEWNRQRRKRNGWAIAPRKLSVSLRKKLPLTTLTGHSYERSPRPIPE